MVKSSKWKYTSIGGRIKEILAIAILIGYMFFMKEGNKVLTYSYLVFELLSILILLMYNNWEIKVNRYVLFVYLLEGYIFILTCYEHSITYSYLCMFLGEIFLVNFVVYNIKKRPYELLFILEAALVFLFILDVFSIAICLMTGNYTNESFGLVGHKNYHSFLFILTIGFKYMCNKLNRNKLYDIRSIVITIISIVCEIFVKSASGLVAVVLLAFLCYFMGKKKLPFINLTTIIIGLLLISGVLISGASASKLLSSIFILLGRDPGLTGRVTIWSETLKLIRERFVIGYGYYKTTYIYFVDRGWIYNHCHNFFLNLVLSGGCFYAIIVCGFMLKIAKEMEKYKSQTIYILTYVIGCYLLLGVSEIVVNVNTMFFPLLILGLYSKRIKEN